jgi:hypothetical protein
MLILCTNGVSLVPRPLKLLGFQHSINFSFFPINYSCQTHCFMYYISLFMYNNKKKCGHFTSKWFKRILCGTVSWLSTPSAAHFPSPASASSARCSAPLKPRGAAVDGRQSSCQTRPAPLCCPGPPWSDGCWLADQIIILWRTSSPPSLPLVPSLLPPPSAPPAGSAQKLRWPPRHRRPGPCPGSGRHSDST